MQYCCIKKEEWDKTVEQLLLSYSIFACVENEYGLDYEVIRPENIAKISYNKPKPATSLKNFFLPVKENVTSLKFDTKPRIIMGIPNCDIEGMRLLDDIYLDKEFCDPFYRIRRDKTLLIASDCIGILENCHCSAYNIKPYSENHADLGLININGTIVLRILSSKGEDFAKTIALVQSQPDKGILAEIEQVHKSTLVMLAESGYFNLPDQKITGRLIASSKMAIWKKYSSKCVACGACTSICPTCTCFLLIDKPGFEKVKQMDACQYPGFERVAGGEDTLFQLPDRFKNRYMCKYIWKAEKFNSPACTGCGRCIDTCIGKINKNELFMELVKQQ
jgi:sulfhydrogenase subunit beta (sulfur reductase)